MTSPERACELSTGEGTECERVSPVESRVAARVPAGRARSRPPIYAAGPTLGRAPGPGLHLVLGASVPTAVVPTVNGSGLQESERVTRVETRVAA